jgi:hypothetical protein
LTNEVLTDNKLAVDKTPRFFAFMKKRLAEKFGLVICLAGLAIMPTGCAFTRTTVAVNFNPAVNCPTGPTVTYLSSVTVVDTRPVEDKFVLTHKFDGYGNRTSGAYVTQQPVADIFQRGLAQALQANGFVQSTNQFRFELRADIQEFDNDVIMGLWQATVKPKLTVRFELMDTNGVSIWRDTMIGRATLETPWGAGEFIVKTFNAAAENAILQLLSDNAFRNCFTPAKR